MKFLQKEVEIFADAQKLSLSVFGKGKGRRRKKESIDKQSMLVKNKP